jgi:hypothetical protein
MSAPTALNLQRTKGSAMGTARQRRQDKRCVCLALELALAGRVEHLKTNEGKDFVPSFASTLAGGRHDYRVSDITATSAKIDVTRPTYDSSSRQLIDKLVMSYVATFST